MTWIYMKEYIYKQGKFSGLSALVHWTFQTSFWYSTWLSDGDSSEF